MIAAGAGIASSLPFRNKSARRAPMGNRASAAQLEIGIIRIPRASAASSHARNDTVRTMRIAARTTKEPNNSKRIVHSGPTYVLVCS